VARQHRDDVDRELRLGGDLHLVGDTVGRRRRAGTARHQRERRLQFDEAESGCDP
jgi:hypothetical protein